jgi:outer membrane protein OmpA-like peptidoglycan-associated protein
MSRSNQIWRLTPASTIACLLAALVAIAASTVKAQNRGPLAAHPGLEITTAFASSFGPDAESTTTFVAVSPQGVQVSYISSRGVRSMRQMSAADTRSARTLVLGYADKMPGLIPGSTTMGFSTAVLDELRATGQANVRLMYDAAQRTIDGVIRQQETFRMPVLIENTLTNLPAVRVTGKFNEGSRQGFGEFILYDDRSSPVLLDYKVQFSWEKGPRTERVVRVTAGNSLRREMETTLKAMQAYEIYGIHFEFDKATIKPQSQPLIADIAETLRVNPRWRLRITGHTDSIGGESYNQKLSEARADSVRSALVNEHGIASDRLETVGMGMRQPKGANDTLQGRKLNRRVELMRIDR